MEYRTLGTVATYINGRAFKPSEWEQNGLPIIRIQNLNDEDASYNYCSQSLDEKFKVKKGDLLFAWSASLGAHIWNKDNAWLNQHIFKVIPDKDVNKMFLYYYLCKVTMELYSKAHGTGMVHITKKPFMNTIIPLPPLAEQERIVAKIEELFSKLDNAVETLKATKAQLKLYKQAVLRSAFSRCIELKKAEDLCFFITKGTTPKKAEFQLEDKSIPFIKVYNLTFDGSLDFTIEPTFIAKSIHETSLARSIVYPGDVLMNIVGPPMGKVSIVPSSYDEWNINQAIARFRCKEELNNRYLAYFLMSSETVEKMSKQTKATAGQFNLTLETCRNIDIPVCSINEQLKIVDNLDTQLTAYNNIEKTVNDALQQATSMRQSILKQAFEGRLL